MTDETVNFRMQPGGQVSPAVDNIVASLLVALRAVRRESHELHARSDHRELDMRDSTAGSIESRPPCRVLRRSRERQVIRDDPSGPLNHTDRSR